MITRDKKNSAVKPVSLRPLTKHPLVSVLIANFNYGDYVGEAIDSVLRSSYRHFEIVICDDGSTDHSLAVLDHYRGRDSRIRVLAQENSGQSVAMHRAYAESSGDIICLLDSDDRFSVQKLECVVKAFQRFPESGFVIHRMRVVDRKGQFLRFCPAVRALPATGWYGPRMSFSAPSLLAGLPPTSGLSMRREVAERILPLAASHRLSFLDRAVHRLAPFITPMVSITHTLSDYCFHGKNGVLQAAFDEELVKSFSAIENEAWHLWRDHLLSIAGELPPPFVAPPVAPPLTIWDYALARLEKRSDYKDYYSRLLESPCYRAIPNKIYRLYWRLSILVPNWAFPQSLAFAYGSGRTKSILGRVANRLRTSLEILSSTSRKQQKCDVPW